MRIETPNASSTLMETISEFRDSLFFKRLGTTINLWNAASTKM